MQAAPAFAETFESIFQSNRKLRDFYCLVPCAIDQDPYFRMCRGIASKLKHHKPAVIHTKFLPSLEGVQTKMSASKPTSCVYLGDSEKQIRKKIASGFSGGQEFLEDHRKYGGNPDIDVAYSLLSFFSENNTLAAETLVKLYSGFKNGSVGCGDMKKAAADVIVKVIADFKNVRSKITQDVVNSYSINKYINF
jgi:tryptophanyl-tRNA synthetase